MSQRIRKSFRGSDKKKISSSHKDIGNRVITKYPLPYSYSCTPNQARNFSDEVHAACLDIHETNREISRMTKVIVVGDVGIGKTTLVKRFCFKPFDTDYKATIGLDVESKKCFILYIPYVLQIWDTAGQEKFKCIAPYYYRGAKVVVLVFKFSDLSSLYNIQKWLERTLECTENPLLFLVGTKKDKLSKSTYKLAEEEAIKIANAIGAEYWPVSSKTGENIEALIRRIAVVSFCHDIIKESEEAKEVTISCDVVKIRKQSSEKKYKKCVPCS